MSDEIGFEDKGVIDVPEKGDIRTEKIISDVKKTIQKDQIKAVVSEEEGVAPEKKGSLTKDVPQMMFRIGAKIINCPKFELDESEASTMATHLNILLPVEGKMASLLVVIMITLNKVFMCMDAIKTKFNKTDIEKTDDNKPKLPEPIS